MREGLRRRVRFPLLYHATRELQKNLSRNFSEANFLKIFQKPVSYLIQAILNILGAMPVGAGLEPGWCRIGAGVGAGLAPDWRRVSAVLAPDWRRVGADFGIHIP